MKYEKYLHSVCLINTIFISFLQKTEITTDKTYSKKSMLLPWSHWGAAQAESWLKLWQYMPLTRGNKDIWQYIHARHKVQNVFCGPTNILEVACVITIFKLLLLLTHAFTQHSWQTSYIYTYIIKKFCIWSNCYKLRHPNSCCFAGEGYVSY